MAQQAEEGYRVGQLIPEPFRNGGYSYGLKHPYIYNEVNGDYLVWHRHSGEVLYKSDKGERSLAMSDIRMRCYELNGLDGYV